MDEELVAAVRERAGHRCEYCLLPAGEHPVPFEVEHVIPEQHGGRTAFGNLALACQRCNKQKGTNLAGLDRVTSRTKLVRVFNPRTHRWPHHFAFDGPRIVGRTPIGRVAVGLLAMNDDRRVRLRDQLTREGVWPPA